MVAMGIWSNSLWYIVGCSVDDQMISVHPLLGDESYDGNRVRCTDNSDCRNITHVAGFSVSLRDCCKLKHISESGEMKVDFYDAIRIPIEMFLCHVIHELQWGCTGNIPTVLK